TYEHFNGKVAVLLLMSKPNEAIGKQIANSEIEDFKQFIKDTDLIFFIAGLGKGTGSGATPVFSKTARELGICTVNIVTLPSMYAEGKPVYQNSIDSYQEIADSCDAFYTLSHDKLYNIYNKDSLEYYESLERANVEIIKPIKLITNIMDCPNTNIGASDILTFFKNTKVFTVLSTSIKDNEQSYQTIMEHFNKALKKNCSIVGYANAKSAILYLTTTPKTSKSLIQDIKSVLASYPDNTNISMFTCTKRYDDTNDVQIEILISSNLQKEEALNNYDTSEIFLQSEDISMNGHMAQVPTDDDNPPDFRIFSNTLDVEPSEENDQSNDGIKIESWTDTSGFTHDNSNFVTTQKLTDKECTDILESVYLKAKK
ncbi:MAG: hypothetical protein HUJ52_02345, partial [Malacoplasma sp.]|nr:hypothetical protein [Malacoplasma sp.]